MKPDIKQKFVAALRSGHYHQGQGRLAIQYVENDQHLYTEFCALGVLLHVMGVQPTEKLLLGTESHKGALRRKYGFRFGPQRYAAAIPPEYQNQAGIGCGDAETLICMNDSDNKTFPQIADWVQENL